MPRKKGQAQPRTCVFCGTQYVLSAHQNRKVYCSDKCSRDAVRQRAKLRKSTNIKSVKVEVEAYVFTDRPVIETDADQARIKREIDSRHGIGHRPCRTLTGIEFEEALKTITPIHLVPKRRSEYMGGIYAR